MKASERSKTTTLTRKGQITIPIAVREALGLQEGDRIEFVLDNGSARLVPLRSVVDRTLGAFKTDAKPLTAEELRRAAEEAIAEDVIRRMSG